jgi:predicted flap endonuclease-1-like 5' DNA nuclease
MKLQNWPIQRLPGLAAQTQTQLQSLGIQTTADLLRQGHTLCQRQALATTLALRVQQVSKWVAMADLARLPGVGCQYCGLLLHAGVGSTRQLSGQSIAELHQRLQRLQVKLLNGRDHCPGPEQVADWINQARRLYPSNPPP